MLDGVVSGGHVALTDTPRLVLCNEGEVCVAGQVRRFSAELLRYPMPVQSHHVLVSLVAVSKGVVRLFKGLEGLAGGARGDEGGPPRVPPDALVIAAIHAGHPGAYHGGVYVDLSVREAVLPF